MSEPRTLGSVLDELWGVIEQRRTADPEASYTARLLTGEEDELLKKIAEEAGEVIMAAKDGDKEHLRYEVGDVVYHLLVVMARWGLTLDDLAEELGFSAYLASSRDPIASTVRTVAVHLSAAALPGDVLPSSRIMRKVAVFTLALALPCVLLSGCGHKSGSGAAAAQGAGASATSSATPSASGTRPAVKPSVYDGPAVIAATSTLEPPTYAGFEPLPCLTYHTVDPKLKNEIAIPPALFESELKTLVSLGYHSITARQLYDHQSKGTPLPDKPVMITFDDGWRNQYVYAAPLLKKYGMAATFFINPQPIAAKYHGYLTRDMVVALAKDGNDIESHTWRHLQVTRERTDSVDSFQRKNLSQLLLANEWIRKVVGQQPVALCYPFGCYDLEAIGMAQRAGYKLGFTVDEGVADARAWDAFQMKRFTISNVETAASFKRRLTSGALQVRDIQPAPGSRIVGISTIVTVDITEVPADITNIKMTSGPSMRTVRIVESDGHRYAVAALHKAKTGFREISMSGTGADGRPYYAAWGIVLGDLPH